MFRNLGLMVLILFVLVTCAPDKPQTSEQETQAAEGDQRMPRRKIERLEPKTFVELTIDLMREEARWHDERARYMEEKRKEYFESFGLSEKQFNDYSENNSAEWQRFLQENPRYSTEYTDAYMTYSRRTP